MARNRVEKARLSPSRSNGRPARARTADFYRLEKEVRKLNPFACLAFPVLTTHKKAPKGPRFGGDLGDEFPPHDARAGVRQSRFVPAVSDCATQHRSQLDGQSPEAFLAD